MDLQANIHNEEGRKLLDLIDEMRQLAEMPKDISLPQIVVVGQQSAGKSSILKALTHIPFPIHHDICTRFATEFVCRRSPDTYTKASIECDSTQDISKKQKMDQFEKYWESHPIETAEDVRQIMVEALHIMGLPEIDSIKPGFSRDRLRLVFGGPSQDHLSLTDLPGLVGSDSAGRVEVDALVKDYLRGEDTIILTVISAGSEKNNLRTYDIVKEHRRQTLGVITAPDTVQGGIQYLKERISVINGETIADEWHIVRNLGKHERDKNMDRDATEIDYFANFASDPNWSGMDHIPLGIEKLRTRLGALLMDRIAVNLPIIRAELLKAREDAEIMLDKLGEDRNTPSQQRYHLVTRARVFQKHVRHSLDGRIDVFGADSGVQSLRDEVRKLNEDFALKMRSEGNTWAIIETGKDLGKCRIPGDALSVVQNEPFPVTVKNMARYISDRVNNNPGKALRGTFDPAWVTNLFREQSRKWELLVFEHAEFICTEVEIRVNNFVKDLVIGDTGSHLLKLIFMPEFERRRRKLHKKMRELLTPSQAQSPATLNMSYVNALQDVTAVQAVEDLRNTYYKEEGVDINVGILILRCMNSYYNIAQDVLLDNIQSLGVENVLLNGLENIFSPESVAIMEDSMLEDLAKESPVDANERTRAQNKIQACNHGLRLISQAQLTSRPRRALQSPPAAVQQQLSILNRRPNDPTADTSLATSVNSNTSVFSNPVYEGSRASAPPAPRSPALKEKSPEPSNMPSVFGQPAARKEEGPTPSKMPGIFGQPPAPTEKAPEPSKMPPMFGQPPAPTEKASEPSKMPPMFGQPPAPTEKVPEPSRAPGVFGQPPASKGKNPEPSWKPPVFKQPFSFGQQPA